MSLVKSKNGVQMVRPLYSVFPPRIATPLTEYFKNKKVCVDYAYVSTSKLPSISYNVAENLIELNIYKLIGKKLTSEQVVQQLADLDLSIPHLRKKLKMREEYIYKPPTLKSEGKHYIETIQALAAENYGLVCMHDLMDTPSAAYCKATTTLSSVFSTEIVNSITVWLKNHLDVKIALSREPKALYSTDYKYGYKVIILNISQLSDVSDPVDIVSLLDHEYILHKQYVSKRLTITGNWYTWNDVTYDMAWYREYMYGDSIGVPASYLAEQTLRYMNLPWVHDAYETTYEKSERESRWLKYQLQSVKAALVTYGFNNVVIEETIKQLIG